MVLTHSAKILPHVLKVASHKHNDWELRCPVVNYSLCVDEIKKIENVLGRDRRGLL
jgi:hypothetical protein